MKEISRQKIYLLHDIRQPNWNLLTKKGERPLLRRLSTEVYELLNCQGTGVERGVVVKLLQLLHIEQLVEVSNTLREPHFGSPLSSFLFSLRLELVFFKCRLSCFTLFTFSNNCIIT